MIPEAERLLVLVSITCCNVRPSDIDRFVLFNTTIMGRKVLLFEPPGTKTISINIVYRSNDIILVRLAIAM